MMTLFCVMVPSWQSTNFVSLHKTQHMYFDNWQEQQPCTVTPSLLWEYNMNEFDWNTMRVVVVQRVIERGWLNDFYAILQLYGGVENIRQIIREIPKLSDKDIAFVCAFFGLKKEELKCCTPKQ